MFADFVSSWASFLDDVFTVLDFPSADAGEIRGEHIRAPFISKHHGFFRFKSVLFHRFRKFRAQRFIRPPETRHIDRFAEFLDHFFATVVRDDDDFHADFFTIFDPIGEFVRRFFFGMKPQSIIEVTKKKFHFFFFQNFRSHIFEAFKFFVCFQNSHVIILPQNKV